MALIHCPNCGEELSDKSRFCSQCGYSMEKVTEQLQEQEKMKIELPIETKEINNKRQPHLSAKKRVLLGSVLLAIFIVAGVAVKFLFRSPEPIIGQWMGVTIHESNGEYQILDNVAIGSLPYIIIRDNGTCSLEMSDISIDGTWSLVPELSNSEDLGDVDRVYAMNFTSGDYEGEEVYLAYYDTEMAGEFLQMLEIGVDSQLGFVRYSS